MAGFARRPLPPRTSAGIVLDLRARRPIAGVARGRAQHLRSSCCRFEAGRLVFARELDGFVDPAEARSFASEAGGVPDVSWRLYVVRLAGPPPIERAHAVLAVYPYLTHDDFDYAELKPGWQRSVEERERRLRERFTLPDEASDFARAARAREILDAEERELFSSSSRERVAVLDRPQKPGRVALGGRLGKRPRFVAHDILGICPPLPECVDALQKEERVRDLPRLVRAGEIFERHASLAPLLVRDPDLRRPAEGLEEFLVPVLEASLLWSLAGPYEGLFHERTNPRSIYRPGASVAQLVEEIYVRVLFGIQQRLCRAQRPEIRALEQPEADYATLVQSALAALEANAELEDADQRSDEEFLELARSEELGGSSEWRIALFQALACFSASLDVAEAAILGLQSLAADARAPIGDLARAALAEIRRCGRMRPGR